MYRVKLYHLRRNVKFVIMNSVYYTDKSLQTFFDLKGSEIGRSAKPGEEVLKDNDLRAKLPKEAFSFSPELRKRLKDQVESDCEFLRKMQIMDYSMLIGIHHIPPKKVDHRSNIGETGFKISEHSSNRNLFRKDHDGDGGDSVSSRGRDGTVKKGDSTRRLIKDIRETAYSASNFEFAGLLEDEDDCSYLEGSEEYKKKYERKLHAQQQHPKYDDVEMKKEQTIEQIYWPFHRFYDINGHRRMKAKECYRCDQYPCCCPGVAALVKAWNIPEFVPPLSHRKDGGLMMDTTGMAQPMVFHGKHGEMQYEGKIYYMGIIDILQQYNARKRVETTYRKVEVRGQAEPSCVSPDDYASRFVRFFEEYSGPSIEDPANADGDCTEIEVTADAANNSFLHISVTSNSDRITSAKDGSIMNNGSLSSSAKITPQDDGNKDPDEAPGIKAHAHTLKTGQAPQGKYVVT
jgi:1-phosphatidylinositol-4-phosphate 5-kinase